MPAVKDMEQRELYAGQALSGLLANPNYKQAPDENVQQFMDRIAKLTWECADAMLRQKTRFRT